MVMILFTVYLCEFIQNRYWRCMTFVFVILCNKYEYVYWNPTLWVTMGVRRVNPSKWELRVASGPI